MSTRANIRFQDGGDFICIDRSHDEHPENILADIKETIDLCKNRWGGAELGQLVSAFLGMHFDKNTRIQKYEPCIGYNKAGGHFEGRKISSMFRSIYRKLGIGGKDQQGIGEYVSHCSDWWGDGTGDMIFVREEAYEDIEEWAKH